MHARWSASAQTLRAGMAPRRAPVVLPSRAAPSVRLAGPASAVRPPRPASAVRPSPAAPATLLFLLLAAILAGCAGPTTPPTQEPAIRDLRWDTPLAVSTTPAEVGELVGFIRVAWGDGLFVILNEKESDLEHANVVASEGIYTSGTGMGWYRQPRSDLAEGSLSNRLVLWDLRLLLSLPDLRVHVATNASDASLRELSADGTFEPTGLALPFHLEMTVAADGRILVARLASPVARESPFTFRPYTQPLTIPVARPDASRVLDRSAAVPKVALAYTAHTRLGRLVLNYTHDHPGLVPQTLDRTSLAVELTTCRCQWPHNAFTDAETTARYAPGDFAWAVCGPADATLTGYGWDGPVYVQPFGKGCVKPAGTASLAPAAGLVPPVGPA